jgi:ammonium transporter, Amt family
LSTAMQGFGLAALITLLWQCFGYSLAFAPANGDDVNAAIFGDASRFWLHGVSGSAHVLAPPFLNLCFAVSS